MNAVRFWSLGGMTRVAIDVSADFKYHSERLTNPDRLFFDIQGARPEMVAKGLRTIAVGDGVLKQIRIAETQPGVTRVVLDLEQRVEFTASQLSSPDRLMIELRAPSGGKDKPATVAGKVTDAGPAARVAPPPSVTHPIVILEEAPVVAVVKKPEPRKFEPPPHTEIARVETVSGLPPELIPPPPLPVMAKPTKPPGPAVSSLKNELPPPPGAAAVAPEKPMTVSGVAAEPAKRNANGDRSLTRVLGLKLGRVVIDPGHGGKDIGTHGPSGLNEKEVVLDVARRLGGLIEDRLGSEVIYTRAEDTFIPLEERTRIANDRKADLFLSIHANSSPIRTAAGVEMYYLNFTTSKAALDVAARENAGSGSSIHDLKDLLQKIALKDKIDESREFAARLQMSLSTMETKGNAAAKNRGLKKAPFIVLIGASMPSVLAEIGFLTNAGDEALLRKPEYRQKIADALYKGIANYADTLSHFQVAQKHE
ncbi:MAG TPA: N-acetylmuramoyl-L-alanine amidase [Bryobacteraceae bacterium]|nr:N-acetylmuramoyl-L-alanine amidase [Bryobacteraceae bacterium]